MLRPWNHIGKSRSVQNSAKPDSLAVRRWLRSRLMRSARHRRRSSSFSSPNAVTESLETRQLLAATPIAGLSDEFDDASSIASWQRVNEVEGWNADQLQQWDINQTQPGRMVMIPESVVWYADWRGPMAFQEVTGDFAFTTQVHITDRDEIGGSDADDVPGDGQYSLGGVMIRTPRDITNPDTDWAPGSMADDGTNNGENYVFLSLGYGAGANEFSLEVKTTRNSNSQLELTALGLDVSVVNVQTARIGTDIITLYQIPGEDWQVHRRYSRPDMPETIQVGLVTYTDWEKASDFDPFYHNGNVLNGDFDPTPGQPFNPDLVAGFEYARYVRPDVPAALLGSDLTDSTSVSDSELLSFLGDNANLVDDGSTDVDDSEDFSLTIPDQTMSRHQDVLQIELPSEAGGSSVNYEVTVVDNIAASLNAEHGFYVFRDDFGLNWGGFDEKWLQGDGGEYFYVLPNGDFFHWTGSFETSDLLATLESEYYDDPALLTSAEPIGVTAGVAGNILTIDPASGFSGGFDVELLSTVGDVSTVSTFHVSVVNHQPVLDAISNQAMVVGSGPLVLDLSASDADGDPLTFDVRITGSLSAEIMAAHNLYEIVGLDDYAINWGGQNEKWLQGDNGWYFLLPDGSLNEWNGSFETSPELAAFSTEIYDDPQLLLNATMPDVSAQVIDGQLVVMSGTQAGIFEIEVIASDGIATDSSVFSLEVTNNVHQPTIADQTLVSGTSLQIELPVTDDDGHTVTYSVEVTGDELSSLDAEHGFWSDGNYYDNYLGQNERWIRDSNQQWHYLLPDGELHQWNGSFESSPLIASLGSEVYDNPTLLTDPQPVPVTATIENGILTITAADGYVGEVQIRVVASDGYAKASTAFQLLVSAGDDEDESGSVDAVYSEWNSLEV